MDHWPEINHWRQTTRQNLIEERLHKTPEARTVAQDRICTLLAENLGDLSETIIGFYWPFKGEVDVRPFIREALMRGAKAALPVVAHTRQPLEFWHWDIETVMTRGVWKIPVPARQQTVQPTILLIPLLGFDQSGYRLGFGGGYYDRTLATLNRRPITIGIGYDSGRLPTIHPQAHDIPMDVIVTETGWTPSARAGQSTPNDTNPDREEERMRFASSPCYAEKFDERK